MIYSKVEDILSKNVDFIWNDKKQNELDKYIDNLRSVLTPSNFYDKVDWEYLKGVLDSQDVDFIKSRADFIYDDLFNPFNDENELNVDKYFKLWKSEDHKILEEALVMIKDLELNMYKDYRSSEEAVETVAVEEENGHDVGVGKEHDVEVSKENGDRIVMTRSVMPKPTGPEGEMSLDLLHKNRESFNRNLSFGHSRRSSVGKPAITSISNINVITKAELTAKSNLEKEKIGPQIKNRLTYVSEKLGLKPRTSRQASQVASTSGKESTGNEAPRKSEETNSMQKIVMSKRNRRLSLMGENLPLYIRKQIEEKGTDESVIARESMDERTASSKASPETPMTSSTTQKFKKSHSHKSVEGEIKNSRIKNLLLNSQSLYAHAKDPESVKSSIKNSPVATTNTSGFETEANGDSDSDDENKEYISPNSLNKYYDSEGEYDGDNVLTDLATDEVEFINVNDSYDELMEGKGNDDEDKDEEDDYLFQL